MQDSKKLFLAIISFVLIFSFLFILITSAAFFNGSEYNDSAKRASLAGQIDLLVVGASHGLAAFDPSIIDKELNLCSYNMSTSSSDIEGRRILLEKELQRNNPDIVVIEIAFDTLSRSSEEENAVGVPYVACKLGSISESLKYICNNTSFFNNDIENILGIFLRYGIKAWATLLSGQFNTLQNNKGYLPESPIDVSLSNIAILETYKSDKVSKAFAEQNVDALIEMIELCNHKNINVILCVVPVSEALVWQYYNMDNFYIQLKEICDNEDCVLMDFNLHKDRFSAINDEESFCNAGHMSEYGAEEFSKMFAQTITCLKKHIDISSNFFKSYEEMIAHSDYMKLYSLNN